MFFPDGDVEIDLVRYGDFLLVPVSINENHEGLFLLDTGSSHTIIDVEMAKQIGLEGIGEVDVKAYGGGSQVTVSPVDRLDVGGVYFLKTFVAQADLGAFRVSEDKPKHCVGMLGMDFLSQVAFTIDFLRAKLVLHDPARRPVAAEADALVLDVRWDMPRVKLQIGTDGVSGLFVVDTGSNHTMQFSGHFASLNYEWIKKLAWTKSIAYGLGGVVESREITLGRVQGLNHEWKDVPVDFKRGAIDEPTESAAGHIGVTFLQAGVMTVDVDRRKIWYSRASESEIDDALKDVERHGMRDLAGAGVLIRAADMGSAALVAEMATCDLILNKPTTMERRPFHTRPVAVTWRCYGLSSPPVGISTTSRREGVRRFSLLCNTETPRVPSYFFKQVPTHRRPTCSGQPRSFSRPKEATWKSSGR